ncbi:MAG: hypothetical protein R3C12_22240 [Planctomycetaceae bacterium]
MIQPQLACQFVGRRGLFQLAIQQQQILNDPLAPHPLATGIVDAPSPFNRRLNFSPVFQIARKHDRY